MNDVKKMNYSILLLCFVMKKMDYWDVILLT